MPAPPKPRALLLLALLCVFGWAAGQEPATVAAVARGDTVLVEVASLARALGVVAHVDGNVLTWRGPNGPVTLFGGTPDALAHLPGDGGPTEVALSAPVVVEGERWYVPLDALSFLGAEVPPFSGRPTLLTMEGGATLQLEYGAAAAPPPASAPAPVVGTTARPAWEPVEAPLTGVRFFDGEGVSLMLLDLALVPLARPELTREVDLAIDKARAAGNDHVLLLMVTAVAPLPWEPVLVFAQDGQRTEVSAPYRLLVEVGEPGTVAPASPVLGAVLLPPSYSLYRPIRVEWAGAVAEVRFRD